MGRLAVLRMEGSATPASDAAAAGKTIRERYADECDRMGSTGAYVTFREDIVRAFNAADADGDDWVSQDEVATIMTELGDDMTETELTELFNAASPRADGKVGFPMFAKAFCDSAWPRPGAAPEKKFFGLF